MRRVRFVHLGVVALAVPRGRLPAMPSDLPDPPSIPRMREGGRVRLRSTMMGTAGQLGACSGRPMCRMLVCLLIVLALGAACDSPSTIAMAAPGRGGQRCGLAYHAGSPVGDGEYTEGAILDTRGISCKQALALVRPRYRGLYRDNRVGAGRSFRIGAFACKSYLDGPNLLKRCLARHRRFDFI